jgi:hypothetical protein
MSKRQLILAGAVILLIGSSPLQADPPSLTTDKSVDPTVIYLRGTGIPDETTVTLTVTGIGDPQIETFPMDVVLVMDKSGSMAGQKMVDAQAAAIDFCFNLEIDFDQSSLVSFNDMASVNSGLTPDHNSTMIAILGLVPGGGTAIGFGIYVAQNELTSSRHRPGSEPVIVLMSDGDNNSGPDPVIEADIAKAQGTIIYTIGLGAGANETLLRAIASDPDSEFYFFAPSSADLDSIYGSIHEHLSNLAAMDVFATEILADSLEYVPGSFSIDPLSISGDTTVWDLGNMNIDDSWVVTFNITASDTGHLPVDDYPNAEATYINYVGEFDSVAFPQAYIDVILSTTGVEENVDERKAEEVSLKVNPNPFFFFPTIQYSLPKDTPVTLEIFNLAGVQIRTLVDELKPAGTYVVDWDTKDNSGKKMSSGVFFLRLKTGTLTSTHKMVLLR